MSVLKLYHTGFDVIKEPDIGAGRANADFGQGFYLSTNEEFSRRWAKERITKTTYVNEYELDLNGLDVKVFGEAGRDDQNGSKIENARIKGELKLEDFNQSIQFQRTKEWFRYIFNNRRHRPDMFPDADVIMGPIANDTIYDTLGIMTSGFLTDEIALQMLRQGPQYIQVAIKSQKAIDNLKWIKASEVTKDQIDQSSQIIEKETNDYLGQITQILGRV